jgi:hypothetical protein
MKTMDSYTERKNVVLSTATLEKLKQVTVKWIVTDCRPISIATDKGFVSLMRAATGCDKYIPPCYATITESIHSMYLERKEQLKSRLANVAAVSLTADFWSSIQNRSYIGVTVHFVEEWTLHSKVLDVFEVSESHTAEACGRILTNVAVDWNITSKVLTIVTDRGRNIVKGVEEFTPFANTHCFAHVIQRGIAAALKASGIAILK